MKPVETDDPRKVGRVLHRILRDHILQGIIEPGTVLDQVSLARGFHVSRTPVREVIRMLKEEGLVTADLNQRAQVAGISYEELEALYAERIANESLTLAVAIECNTQEDKDRIETALERLAQTFANFEADDLRDWVRVHREFHLALYHSAGEAVIDLVRPGIEKSERFQSIRWRHRAPRDHATDGGGEHRGIAESCLAGDVAEGVQRLSLHLTKTALETLNDLAPDREPRLIRRALRFANAGAAGIATG